MAGEKSKILVIGGTGSIGKFVVEASARLGHPTFALVRESASSDPAKAEIIEGFKNLGVALINGDLQNYESLVKAVRRADAVISTVGAAQVADQANIIAAIKEAGNITRFLPSEFGNVTEATIAVPPLSDIISGKAAIRRAVEAEGIPYTYISSNFASSFFLPSIGQVVGPKGIPRDKVVILGDGDARVVFVGDEDIGTYTVKAADDPRTLNKILYMRPPGDIYSHNELVSLWEKKSGKKLERVYLSEDEILKMIQAIFVNEEDIGAYTIKAADDPRTLNKIVYIRPPGNIYTHNELVSLWEKKTGKTLKRIYLAEDEVVKKIQEAPFPVNIIIAINYSVFVKGDTTNIEIDPSFGVEASELYPDVKYTTVEEYISRLA